jgi:hypothetical protein
MVTPPAIAGIGAKFYIVFAVTNACLVPLLYIFFPETARLSLEEIDALFVDDKVYMRRSPREPVIGFADGLGGPKPEQGQQEFVEKAGSSV